MPTGLISSDRFLDHDTGLGHPERPDRLRAIVAALKQAGVCDQLTHLPFEAATRQQIARLHDPAYIDRASQSCKRGERYIDTPDSAICPASAEIAMLAAGGVIAAVDAVMRGGVGGVANAFCAVRPPGHHAERDRSMGFCLFNNIALAAEHLIVEHHLERIAIVDFDVHHGNGTQHLFEHRRDVLFISIHEDPRSLYPGTGFAEERGIGEGEGYTLNIPLAPGSGDEEYLRVFDETIIPRVAEHEPQFLLISAGFDAAAADLLAHMQVTPAGFEAMTQRLADAAHQHCNDRLVSVLEGGYDLDALAESVTRHVRVLMSSPRTGVPDSGSARAD